MPITNQQLDDAVARGIITAAQRQALVTLADTPAGMTATTERAPAVVIAYGAGAACVLLAFGWVLVEQWQRLGPGGVLLVSLAYATVFTYASVLLRREGFPLAAAFAALLAVGMTPIVTWSLLSLAGWWPAGARIDTWLWPTRWAVIELATALVAIIAWRTTRFAPLVLPIAIAGWLAPLHIASAFYDRDIEGAMFGWGSFVTGSMLFAAAYHVQRVAYRDAPEAAGSRTLFTDAAGWIFRVTIVAFVVGTVSLFDSSAVVRHGLLPLAVFGAVAAVRLGRRELIGAAALAFVAYLGYLAFDVFEDFLSFPVLLATFGITMIAAAVTIQRRWPTIATRLAEGRDVEPRLPGHYLAPAMLFAIALGSLFLEPPRARERMREQAVERARYVREERARRRAAGVSPRGETEPVRATQRGAETGETPRRPVP